MQTPSTGTDRLVVLARGLGTRMRQANDAAHLDEQQARIADSGLKALIPIDRPFLDYVLTAAAAAGFRRICLVIGPEHTQLRDYYAKLPASRLSFDFAIQEQPLGTANAVAAAEPWAAGQPFVVINSDNHYPTEALAALRTMPAPGVALFDRQAMLDGSNIPAERIEKFAIGELADGCLRRVIEKPSPQQIQHVAETSGGRLYLSMNLWLFNAAIFDACRAIPKSQRGEYEITDAVQYAIDHLDQRFTAAQIHAPVLDLSSRADIEPVARRLRGAEVSL